MNGFWRQNITLVRKRRYQRNIKLWDSVWKSLPTLSQNAKLDTDIEVNAVLTKLKSKKPELVAIS